MINIEVWLNTYLCALQQEFGDRVCFVGLQGSYGRGEATESSDIDMVVILDELTASDIHKYHDMLDTLQHREVICGFISGKDELLHWETSDLFQFYHDTIPILGKLEPLLPQIDVHAVNRAIKMGACNIYHGCVHNMLYEKSNDILNGLYKAASFVVQAIAYKESGSYIRLKKDLLDVLSDRDRNVLKDYMAIKEGAEICFDEMSIRLFAWSKYWISNT